MGIFRSMDGMVRARLVSADVYGLLGRLSRQDVILLRPVQTDAITVEVLLRRADLPKARALAVRGGGQLRVLSKLGIYWDLYALRKRKLLLLGMLLLLFLTLYLPGRVLFVEVEGNTTLPDSYLLEQAERCGIRFGTSRRQVRSEQVKNLLLEAVPQLQWAGVTTRGCTAQIIVRERLPEEQEKTCVSSLVASRDGVVQSVTVTAGTPLCTPGEAVQKGQTLISGFSDCGPVIRAEAARGEVYAFTNRRIQAVTPASATKKTACGAVTKKYSLILGKKRINFFNDSGISGTGCDKMYKEIYVTLPGGFRLPVRLAVEVRTERTLAVRAVEDTACLTAFAGNCLAQQMVAGKVLRRQESVTRDADVFVLQGQYHCLEMIGRERIEETLHGKTD